MKNLIVWINQPCKLYSPGCGVVCKALLVVTNGISFWFQGFDSKCMKCSLFTYVLRSNLANTDCGYSNII